MSTIQLVNKSYYEVFEIHTMPRGIVCLTLRINKKKASQFISGIGNVKIPVDSLTLVICKDETIPDNANFVYKSSYDFISGYRYTTTKDFIEIHKRIDAIKDALNYTNLHLFIEDKEILPYQNGVRHKTKGIYLGVEEDEHGKHHKFINNNITFKEYVE